MTEPTPLDIANAEARAGFAAKQLAEYQEAQRIAREALGRGWRPWMRISVVPGDYHTGNAKPVAIAYTIYVGERKTAGAAMFVRRMPDGTVKAAKTYEELFGELLTEPDPVRTIDIGGKAVHPPRYCVCWAAVELYRPKSAEALAAARVKRQEKADKQAVEAEAKDSLFGDIIRAQGPVKGRGR